MLSEFVWGIGYLLGHDVVYSFYSEIALEVTFTPEVSPLELTMSDFKYIL